MNSDKNDAQKLPDGWVLCQSKSNPGRKYYFNKKTGKSSWTKPLAVETNVREFNKQKGKKEKKISPAKRKEELQKKNLKRKSGSNECSPTKKKQKQEESPEKGRHELYKTPSPTKHQSESPVKKQEEPHKCETPVRPTPSKNLASSRLSLLREQLNAEVQASKHALNRTETETQNSPSKRLRVSPKTPQIETQAKTPKLDLKSPIQNETKSSTAHSPSSDSLQSIPSPSQFFAANKIISSMKAQLPDQYCNNLKPKDTFADIEQGICSQTTEYPYMKHPATPPQFSEASKLVSAIKSKLSYKVTLKDVSLKTFSSAKDRMESLRSRLSNDLSNEISNEVVNEVMNEDKEIPTVTDEEFLSKIELPPTEAMEVEDCKEIKQSMSSIQGSIENNENIVLVVDTNIFIHELDVIKEVLNSHIKGHSSSPTLLVPWRVINELDRLKDNNNGTGAICKRARAAMDYLYQSLPENNRIKGQSLRDSNSHIYPCESPDDEILNCCLQQAERGKSVILLSNDKNLCSKAVINGVRCIGLSELKPLLTRAAPAAAPAARALLRLCETTLYHLLANILENEMRAKYNKLWQHVVFKSPPWSLGDVLQCLLKHWIAVFSEVFPRIEHLLTDLRNAHDSIQSKDANSLTQSEVTNYKDLCIEIAKKCQIIPEYMELAKATLERLQRGVSERQRCASERPDVSEMPVIDAFEALWTVFSGYCAKLASSLDISHSLEHTLAGSESLPDLISKWPMFSSQIRELTLAMKGSLEGDMSDPGMQEHLVQLEIVFKESLALISTHSDGIGAITQANLRAFCSNCRNMLQEALAKFTGLSELLEVCRNHIANQ